MNPLRRFRIEASVSWAQLVEVVSGAAERLDRSEVCEYDAQRLEEAAACLRAKMTAPPGEER